VHHPEPWSAEIEREYHERFSRQVDHTLDGGHGECWLRTAAVRVQSREINPFLFLDDLLPDWFQLPSDLRSDGSRLQAQTVPLNPTTIPNDYPELAEQCKQNALRYIT